MPAFLTRFPTAGAFFTTYEGVKSLLTHHNPAIGSTNKRPLLPQPIIYGLASSLGELVSCAILTPAEVIKQNAQMVDTSSSGRTSTGATMATLRRFRSNPLALWRGYTALAGRNLPFTALQFPMFERLKEALKKQRERSGKRTGSLEESGLITAISAGTAGSIAAVITTPIDVIKTRIMLSAGDGEGARGRSSGGSGKNNGLVDALGKRAKETKGGIMKAMTDPGSSRRDGDRKGTLAIAKELFAKDGMKGLWRGGALRAIWTMLGSGLYLGVYESGRIWLATRRGQKINEDDLL